MHCRNTTLILLFLLATVTCLSAQLQLGGTFVEDSPIFSIFPNPSNGMFSIQAEGARRSGFHYSLYDLKGKKMIQGQFKSNSMEIDATFLPKGLYLLQIKAQQAQIVKRILIQ